MLFSCTEKFYPEIDENVSILVVDGKITDELNSCEVSLFRTVNYTDDYLLKPERNALVVLFNDLGQSEILHETKPGFYQNTSSTLKGETDRNYWIKIKTLTGEEYESAPETMQPAINIKSIYGEEIDEILDQDISKQAVKFYFDTQPENQSGKYIRWEYKESYEWHTPFSSEITVSQNPSHICYPVNRFDQINVFDASNYTIAEVAHLPVSTIFNNEVKLLHNYLIDLKVYSVSQENYIFWKNMKTIHQTNGNLYDVIPANILGNVSSCDETCQVLGYFEVSSVRTSQKIFTENDFTIEFADFPEECEEFTMILEDQLRPDQTKYHIISSSPGTDDAIIYSVRLIECYECNLKYSPIKPSFWP